MNLILGLTLIGIISGLSAGFIGAGAEILIVPLLTLFGIFNSLKILFEKEDITIIGYDINRWIRKS